MDKKKFILGDELKSLLISIKTLDQKAVIVFLSIAVLQTISWYYTSRRFFRVNFFDSLQFDPNVYLFEYLYWFIGDFFTLFILPFFIIKVLLREKIKDYGIKFGDYKAGLIITLIFLAIMIPLVWIASSTSEFSRTYPHLSSVKNSWIVFMIYELGMFIYMISWEFIWRGFMLFGLEKKFGYYSVLIQMIPFLILHNGKPSAETFGAIIAGIALGILALRTRSIFYCVVAHASVMFSIDFISTLRYRSGDYGIGLNSLINILKEIL